MKKISFIAIVLFTVCSVYAKTPAASAYKIVNKISLEGNEKWDYLFSDDKASLTPGAKINKSAPLFPRIEKLEKSV